MNGTHALKLLTFPVDKPAAVSAGQSHDVGEAVASTVAALACALAEYQVSGFIDKTRLTLGERAAKVSMMMLAESDDLNFAAHARAAAYPILRRQLEGHCTPEQVDRAIDFCLDIVLEVATGVVASERAFVAAMNNEQRTAHHG